MLFTTSSQWIALAVAIVAGWLLGLASHPGGRKWKTRYAAERDAHAATRRDLEARIATAEEENRRLARAAPVTAATVAPNAAAASASSASSSTVRPAYPDERRV